MSNFCFKCGKETQNVKYCSRSCAASINNTQPKRKLEGRCVKCSCLIKSSRKYCKTCRTLELGAKDMTLQQAIYEKHHRSSAYALVRARARNSEKAKSIKCCEKCGWSNHVEVCHKIPISNFSLTTLLSEINSEENLLILCPNCHWMFDHPNG